MTTLLTEQAGTVEGGRVDGDGLWLATHDAETATGWALKPEGFCKGDICVPVPTARKQEFADNGEINVAALWRHMGMTVVHDRARETWVLGASAADRASRLETLQAPDFALPDLDGRTYTLAEHRGKKVLLVSWASW